MSYLFDALKHLGIYYTPRQVLTSCYGSGKTLRTPDEYMPGNPPFGGNPMQVGSTEYHATLRRWAALHEQPSRTFAEQAEMEALHRRLDAAERAGFRGLVEDYDQLMQMGDLGGCEVI